MTAIDRDPYWDAVKGVSIVAVIAIHALAAPSALPPDTFGYQSALLTRQVINFAVPMFLALAGYMAGTKPIGAGFVASRLVRLLPPYLLWTAAYVVLFRDGLGSPLALAKDIFMGSGIGIGYFVIVLAQMVVLTPLISRLPSLRAHLAVMVAGSLAGLAFTYGFQIGMPDHQLAAFPANALAFWVWYPFYHLGFAAARYLAVGAPQWRRALPILIFGWVVLVAASEIEGQFLTAAGLPAFAMSQTKATSILASTVLVLIVFAAWSALKHRVPAALAGLGANSYFVYLTHLLVFAVFAKAWAKMGFQINPLLYSAILIPAAVLICSAGVYAGRRLLPPAVQKVVLG